MEQTQQLPIGGVKLPFRTQDTTVAFCLYMAGIPEWMPPTNTYDREMLRKLGYRGLTLEEGARTAAKKGDRGQVDYWFESTPELPHFLKAFEDQQAQIKAEGENIDAGAALRDVMARVAGRDPKTNEAITPMDEREGLLRTACVCLKLRPTFANRWKGQKPFIRVPGNGSEAPHTRKGADGWTTVTGPGFKLIPIDLPESRRKELGV